MGIAALNPSYEFAGSPAFAGHDDCRCGGTEGNPMADNDDVPFNRNFPLKPGVVEEVVPGVRRVLCDNPSPFTFTGTVSYIVGQGKVAIIDPGPDNAAHAQALLEAVRGESVTHILVTHTHRDHSPNTARIKAATGATVYAEGPHRASRPRFESEKHNPESGADRDFKPDVSLRHGEVIDGTSWKLEAVATPGHTANHLAFAWPERKISFVGDHVMGWSTSIVAPPDGSMIDYMASLERLTQREENLYFSGHGPEIVEGPRYVRFLIRHRQAREASILHRLAKGEADIPTMVRAIYIGIDPRLMNAAGYSVLAHLEDLVGRGIVATDGDPVIGGMYRLARAANSE
jgi:glyoxylase-like metal-dependent hydrolase (beta-lactamase superfamily II)